MKDINQVLAMIVGLDTPPVDKPRKTQPRKTGKVGRGDRGDAEATRIRLFEACKILADRNGKLPPQSAIAKFTNLHGSTVCKYLQILVREKKIVQITGTHAFYISPDTLAKALVLGDREKLELERDSVLGGFFKRSK